MNIKPTDEQIGELQMGNDGKIELLKRWQEVSKNHEKAISAAKTNQYN